MITLNALQNTTEKLDGIKLIFTNFLLSKQICTLELLFSVNNITFDKIVHRR